MARLIMRVADSIFAGTPGGGRGVPLAELCSVLLLATPQPPQNPSAQPGTGVSAEFNTEASGDLTAVGSLKMFIESVQRLAGPFPHCSNRRSRGSVSRPRL